CVYSFRLTATPQLYSLSLHDALPIYEIARREVVIDQDDLVEPRALDLGADLRLRLGNGVVHVRRARVFLMRRSRHNTAFGPSGRSEEHTSELQSHLNLVCRLLLDKKQ